MTNLDLMDLFISKKNNLFLVACVLNFFMMYVIFKFQLLSKLFYFIFLEYTTYYLWAFSSKYKFPQLILWDGCSSYNQTSKKKSSLIHKPSVEILKPFNQHDLISMIWKNNKICRSKYFDIARINKIVQGCCDKGFSKTWVAWIEVSPRVMITRFLEPVQFSQLLGQSWSSKINNFWGSK